MLDFKGKFVIVHSTVEFILWMHYLYDIIQCLRTKFIKTLP